MAGGFFCWRRMRIAVLVALLIVAAPAAAVPRRSPGLLLPSDARRFEQVSSRFGMRRLQGHRRLHRGVDLVAPSGSWVVAAREGKVTDAGRARACGWYVTVEHENGWRAGYCHLRSDPRLLGVAGGGGGPAPGGARGGGGCPPWASSARSAARAIRPGRTSTSRCWITADRRRIRCRRCTRRRRRSASSSAWGWRRERARAPGRAVPRAGFARRHRRERTRGGRGVRGDRARVAALARGR